MGDIVVIKNSEAFTTSHVIAEKFGKNHRNVLKAIDNLLKNLGAQNGAPKKAIFKKKSKHYKGQDFRFYELNKSAFSLLAMRFTGGPALAWQVKFIDAFDDLEDIVKQQFNQEWSTEREHGKAIRIELTNVIAQFVEYSKVQGSKNAERYFANITKMEYKALCLIEKNEKIEKGFRNTLDFMQLHILLSSEMTARKALLDGMQQKLHYKDIYQLAKKRVLELANVMMVKTVNQVEQNG